MSDSFVVRLGTRGSQLALYQANAVARSLAAGGGPRCEIVVIKTSGDQLQDAPLSVVGGKRLFVKELEDALSGGEIDLAVHSSKDMPAVLPDGLTIAGVLPREDPLDAVVLPAGGAGGRAAPADVRELIAWLGPSPTIATSSVRRVAQLSKLLRGATFRAIRGNLDTRLRKLDGGSPGGERADGLVLAAAGLRRLGLASRISLTLPAAACVPAPGQGIIAIEIRRGDERMAAAIQPTSDRSAEASLTAERALVEALGAGCQTPVGALATPAGADRLALTAIVIALDGSREVRATADGPARGAADLGRRVADDLLTRGAGEILDEAQRQQAGAPATTPTP
jgi:hydroxymethylbilane synthase